MFKWPWVCLSFVNIFPPHIKAALPTCTLSGDSTCTSTARAAKVFLHSSVILQLHTHTFYFQTLLGNVSCSSCCITASCSGWIPQHWIWDALSYFATIIFFILNQLFASQSEEQESPEKNNIPDEWIMRKHKFDLEVWSLPWWPGASPSASQPPPWWAAEKTDYMTVN